MLVSGLPTHTEHESISDSIFVTQDTLDTVACNAPEKSQFVGLRLELMKDMSHFNSLVMDSVTMTSTLGGT